jgi:hypothetical protein
MGESRRVMTSAIHGMSVADVRRNLASIRAQWHAHSVGEPFSCFCDVHGVSAAEFGYKFVLGHHRKRHAKSTHA